MKMWESIVCCVRSFNEAGKPNHALAALGMILLALLLVARALRLQRAVAREHLQCIRRDEPRFAFDQDVADPLKSLKTLAMPRSIMEQSAIAEYL